MFISNRDIKGNPYTLIAPFASKALDGGTLFRRVYGQTFNLIPNDEKIIFFIVPYNLVKINKIDLHWFPEGCTCNFKIYDSATSSLQIKLGVPTEYLVPNKLIDQFGFAATISAGHHDEYSEYDAELLKDMKVEIAITNTTSSNKLVGCNIIYHEVKA